MQDSVIDAPKPVKLTFGRIGKTGLIHAWQSAGTILQALCDETLWTSWRAQEFHREEAHGGPGMASCRDCETRARILASGLEGQPVPITEAPLPDQGNCGTCGLGGSKGPGGEVLHHHVSMGLVLVAAKGRGGCREFKVKSVVKAHDPVVPVASQTIRPTMVSSTAKPPCTDCKRYIVGPILRGPSEEPICARCKRVRDELPVGAAPEAQEQEKQEEELMSKQTTSVEKSRAECETCNKVYTVTASGVMRRHKCDRLAHAAALAVKGPAKASKPVRAQTATMVKAVKITRVGGMPVVAVPARFLGRLGFKAGDRARVCLDKSAQTFETTLRKRDHTVAWFIPRDVFKQLGVEFGQRVPVDFGAWALIDGTPPVEVTDKPKVANKAPKGAKASKVAATPSGVARMFLDGLRGVKAQMTLDIEGATSVKSGTIEQLLAFCDKLASSSLEWNVKGIEIEA